MSASRPDAPLGGEEQAVLLQAARRAITASLSRDPLPRPEAVPPRLLEHRAAFVTLRRGGDLRGCIGVVPAAGPLFETVVRCAVAAAFEDPRFPALRADEVTGLMVEISALTPPHPVLDVEEIEIGRHGLILSMGGRRGLLLPQVALEHGWDRLTFLRETCLKANLDPEAWKRGARIEVFEAQVFSDGPRT